MQDAVLIYYLVANFLRVGCFADVAKVVRRMMIQLYAALTARPNSASARLAAGTRSYAADFMPAYREFEDWVERLTRMESYVLSMR
jgi:hypothetical protein